MKAVIGVYNSHTEAVKAVQELQNNGYKPQQISILGKAKDINHHIHVNSSHLPEEIEVSLGVVAGSILGILTGIGIFAVPGLGFLYGAGALVGAFAGLDFGIIGGGLVAILTQVGVDSAKATQYENLLKQGKFILVVQSSEEEIDRAHQVLHAHGTPSELEIY